MYKYVSCLTNLTRPYQSLLAWMVPNFFEAIERPSQVERRTHLRMYKKHNELDYFWVCVLESPNDPVLKLESLFFVWKTLCVCCTCSWILPEALYGNVFNVGHAAHSLTWRAAPEQKPTSVVKSY